MNDDIRENIDKTKKKPCFKYFVFTLFGGACLGICLFIGCFNGTNVETPHQAIQQAQKKDYNVLINQWNAAVLTSDLNNSFELPRGDAQKLFLKLNYLLGHTKSYDNFLNQNQCVLNTSKKIFIPSSEYASFLQESEFKYKVNFTDKYSGDEIIQELKKVTNSKYIDYEMLNKVAYVNSFEIFFEKNKRKFYDDGFSKHIENFETYKKAVSRCK